MAFKIEKFVAIAAAGAAAVAMMTTTPVLAYGFHHHAYRVGGYRLRVRYGYVGYGRSDVFLTRRKIGRIYARGYGGFLRSDFYGRGIGFPDSYYGLRHPYGYGPVARAVTYPYAGYGQGALGLGLFY